MARQGHAFVTADDARVVTVEEGSDVLKDVPADGKTLGEIVTRGNIVMKEASDRSAVISLFHGDPYLRASSIITTPPPPRRHSGVGSSIRVTLLSCIRMVPFLSWIEARTSSSPGAR
jgi:hypothetical protein